MPEVLIDAYYIGEFDAKESTAFLHWFKKEVGTEYEVTDCGKFCRSITVFEITEGEADKIDNFLGT